MYFYLFQFIIVSVFSFCYSKSKDYAASVCFIVLAFFCIMLPVGLRYGIGQDYFNYVKNFGIFKSGHYIRSEVGLKFIYLFCIKLGLSIQYAFFIIAFLTFYFLFISIEKKYFYICIPLFFLTLYGETYNTIRQCLAASICLYGTKCFFNGKNIKALLFYLLAVTFHSSAFIYFVFFILLLIPFDFRGIKSYFIFFGIIIFFKSVNILDPFKEILQLTKYAFYLETDYIKTANLGSGFGFLLTMVLLFFMLYLTNKNENDKELKFVFLSIYAMLSLRLISLQVSLFYRLILFFYINYVIVIQNCIKSTKKYKKLLIDFILFSFLLMFIKSLTNNQVNNIPYRSIFNIY